MTDILGKLKDLHKQATEERSHYYTGACVLQAITEIADLRAKLEAANAEIEKWKKTAMPTSEQARRYEEAIGDLQDKLAEAERRSRDEYGWLVEDSRNHPSGVRYRTWGDFGPEWTNDPNKAIRFARRRDAEMFARDDEDAWHIVEHMWPAIDSARGGERG